MTNDLKISRVLSMKNKFGCFISAGSVLDGHATWILSAAFVQRAADHIEHTHKPYLAHHDDDYRLTIIARPAAHGRYELGSADVLVRAHPSWRQLYWHRYANRVSPRDFRARFRFAEDEWDAQAESAAADAMALDGWRRVGEDCESIHPLLGLEIPRFQIDGAAPYPGRLYWLEGTERTAGRVLVASSALALSCLQFWLDELGAGIRIQLDERADL